jgi:Spy/CpxP family protein refolding chaperone
MNPQRRPAMGSPARPLPARRRGGAAADPTAPSGDTPMKRLALCLALAAALGFVTSTLWAQEVKQEAKKEDKPAKPKEGPAKEKKPILMGAHAEMAKACALTEEQQKKIADLNEARQKALKEFEAANAEKLTAAREDLKKATEAKDKDAAKKAQDAIAAINTQRMEIDKKAQADIMAVLTPEQAAKWQEYQVLRTVQMRYRKAELTEEQMGKVKEACSKAIAGVDLKDEKARAEIVKKLSEQVEKDILTDAQREALKPKPAEKKPEGEKKEEKKEEKKVAAPAAEAK